MTKTQKQILLGIVTLLLLLTAGYIIGQKQLSQQPNAQPTDLPTHNPTLDEVTETEIPSVKVNLPEGWQTYTAPDQSFTIAFPADWGVKRDDTHVMTGFNLVSPETQKRFEELQGDDSKPEWFDDNPEAWFAMYPDVRLRVYKTLEEGTGYRTITEFIKDNNEIKALLGQKDLGGKVFQEIILQGEGSDYLLVTEHAGKFYELGVPNVEKVEDIKPLSKQIIETFRILK